MDGRMKTSEFITTDKKILTVSELNHSVKKLLETHFHAIWIEGEISNLTRPQSGHLYFTLKDMNSQVRCAMFRNRNLVLPFEIQNGMHLLAYAKISLYEGRGDYQLIIEHIEERGEGLLRRRFELLKIKLANEGLFDTSKKKPLPAFPRKIGVVTSPTGAAIRDVLSVLKRRFATIPIIIYPTGVQGDQAARQIAEAIALANTRKECDVLIICRGGGSLEDLWAFNEEIVARAIYESKIPTVAGIGHEIDFTISDYVVDYRAPTPSAAAEQVSPNQVEYRQRVADISKRLAHCLLNEIKHAKLTLKNYRSRFLDPTNLLQQHFQALDMLSQSLFNIFKGRLETEKNKVQFLQLKLQHKSPDQFLKESRTKLVTNRQLLNQLIRRKIAESKQSLAAMLRTLNTVSPLQTLERGYSITMKNGHIIDDVILVKKGDNITIQVKTGYLFCIVENCEPL
jgi:exodeoxyribonuclease VII large subunit